MIKNNKIENEIYEIKFSLCHYDDNLITFT